LQKFGLDTTSVAAALASCGVAVGLALQGSLSNFAGGVLILILKPFVVGDYIVEDNKGREGTVKEIQLFYTKLVTPDNKTVIIPNGSLANTSLTNVTAQDKRRLDFTVGISYDADMKKAKQLMEQLLHADESMLKEEGIQVFVDNLGDSAVVIGARGWVKKEDYWTAKWRITEQIKESFDANDIEIPYQQIVVHTK
jgi:small conductance mechanosensitive channel